MLLILTYSDVVLRLIAALIFGGMIGVERTIVKKKAGVRTYSLVSLGACLFVVVSELIAIKYIGLTTFDPSRIASQIVVGMGFLGGGLIILHGTNLRGLTTAAGLWVAAAIGTAVGFGFYLVGFTAAILTLVILTFLWNFEQGVKKFFSLHGKDS